MPTGKTELYRLSAAVGAVLERCDGRSTGQDIAASLHIADPKARGQLFHIIKELIALHAASVRA